MRKKGQGMPLPTLGRIVLLLLFLVVVVTLLFTVYRTYVVGEGPVTLNDVSCKVSVVVSAMSRDVFKIKALPALCQPRILRDPLIGDQDEVMRTVTGYMRRCWWWYGEGEIDDLGSTIGDETFLCFAFVMGEDLDLDDLVRYMITHRKGALIEDERDSDWNFIESGDDVNICFDRVSFIGDQKKFNQGDVYYVKFRDDKQAWKPGGNNDMILVSGDPNFGNWRSLGFASVARGSDYLCYGVK